MKQAVSSGQVLELLQSQLESWPLARDNYRALQQVRTREFSYGDFYVKAQFNPARIVSASAKVDDRSFKDKKCFLCPKNLPEQQKGILFGEDYQILVNPYPIFPQHFTIPALKHLPQRILHRFADMLDMSQALDEFVIFYNGPHSGASVPDHVHFQAGNKGFLPVEKEWAQVENNLIYKGEGIELYELKDYLRSTLVIRSESKENTIKLFNDIYHSLEIKPGEEEPGMNILTWYDDDNVLVTILFLREKHRPSCYYAEGEENILVSPGAVDMGGVIITPLKKDFDKITKENIAGIMQEVSLNDRQMHKLKEHLNKLL